MDATLNDVVSPHRVFSKESWARLRDDRPLNLSLQELQTLRALGDPVSLEEVEKIYLPISRLLAMHVEETQKLFERRKNFLNVTDGVKTPFIIGIAGSVAVGKSTTARVLQKLLSRWGSAPKVDLITTDGFLFPNTILEAEGLMRRKGFPESYDQRALLRFLADIKTGKPQVEAPVYSHLVYDVILGEKAVVDRPDILIFEGINVLQTRSLPKDGNAIPFVSDFFDYSIYIDAKEELIEKWYIDRFMQLRETAFQKPKSYFREVAMLSEEKALAMAKDLWASINRVNLVENIQPTRPRADLILQKGESHMIETVFLRRL